VARYFGLALVFGFLLLPTAAQAQYRRGRYAQPMTADGPAYNPALTPEWRQAGGNYAVWEQIMMNKMAAQEQAAFQKQLAAYQKQVAAYQKQLKAKGLTTPQPVMTAAVPQRRVKKKPTLRPSTVAKPKDDKAAKSDATEATAKPDATTSPKTADSTK
jgi:hypothetical protein